jgi:hypothetical protein
MVSYGLLHVVENSENGCMYVSSVRAEKNIKAYLEKCEKARLNGAKGGKKSNRKAKGTRTAKRTLTDSGSESQAKKRKEKKAIENLYGSQIASAADGAAVEGTTPPSALLCPKHHTPLKRTGMGGDCEWWCDECMDGYSSGAVA